MTALGVAAFIVAGLAASFGPALQAVRMARHLRRRIARVEERLDAAYLRGAVIRPSFETKRLRGSRSGLESSSTYGDEA